MRIWSRIFYHHMGMPCKGRAAMANQMPVQRGVSNVRLVCYRVGVFLKYTIFKRYFKHCAHRGHCKPHANRAVSAAMLRVLLQFVLLGLVGISQTAHAATPPGTPIINTAYASYTHNGMPQQVEATSAVNTAQRTPAQIDFLLAVNPAIAGVPPGTPTQVYASACKKGGGTAGAWQPQTSAQTVFGKPNTFNAPNTVPLVAAPIYMGRDAAFVRVIDHDQNQNQNQAETVEVSVKSHNNTVRLRLTETGASTGVFVGWVQLNNRQHSTNTCTLAVAPNSKISAYYVDKNDKTDARSTTALIDPMGTVFRSDNGQPVDGAQVTLINADTGQAAQVFGDDGVSSYPATVISGAAVTDGSGYTYPAVAGQYRFPLVRPGNYRLQIVPPKGLSYPSTVADGALQKLPNAPYDLTPASRGDDFAVIMAIIRTDIPLDPRTGKLLVTKQTNKTRAAPGDFVRYTVSVTNQDTAAANNVVLTDVLPQGLRYQAGSAKNKAGAAQPVTPSPNGRTLQFAVGALQPKATATISYVVEVTVQTPLGTAVNIATATGDGAISSSAKAAVEIFDDLMASKAILVGTVFEGQCPKAGQAYPKKTISGARLLMHNGRFAVSGADGAWHIEGVEAGTNMVRLDNLSIPKGYTISPCPNGSRNSALGWAQTVRALPGGIYRVNFFVQPPKNAVATANDLKNKQPSSKQPSKTLSQSSLSALDAAKKQALASGNSNAAWIYPTTEAVPNTYSSLMLRHAADAKLHLTLNGAPVSGFHYEGISRSDDGATAVSFWRNVHLKYGANQLVATIERPNQAAQQLKRVVHVATAPVRAELVPEQSQLIANGRDPVVVAIRLLDKDNQPVRADVSGDITLNTPYQMADVLANRLVNPLSGHLDASQRATPRYIVGADGVALLHIAPTTQAGKLEVGFKFNDKRTQTISAQVLPQNREWIVVGFAETSVIGRKLHNKMQPISGYAIDTPTIPKGRVALFAKGVVPGDFLMTLAYDSAKPRIAPTHQGTGSSSTISDNFYTVYADNAQSGNETPSDGKLYLKIEKSTFQLLWGNFNTGLSRTELARYDRSVYGLQSSWQGNKLSYTAFAFENRTASQRDVIRADGTTGSYRLKRLPVLEQSERVSIVTRQRLDSTAVLERRTLARQADYTLDYPSGLLILAQAIPTADLQGNPISIEVDYESKDAAGGRTIAGGRVAMQVTKNTEAGLSLIHDGDSRLGGQLAAVDVRSKITPNTSIELEAGISHRDDVAGVRNTKPNATANADNSARGRALRAEIRHQSAKNQLRAYAQSIDAGYGLPDQSGVQAGVRSIGVEAKRELSPNTRIEASVRQQEDTDTTQRSRAAEAKIHYQNKGWQLGAGLRWVQERDSNHTSASFAQWLASAAYTTANQRLTMRGSVEMAANQHSAVHFPDRIALGADYRLTSNLTMLATQEWTRDAQHRALSQVGLRYTPWAGASIQTTVAQSRLLSGNHAQTPQQQTSLRTQANQSFQLGKGWAVNAQVTHARKLREKWLTPQNTNSPASKKADNAGTIDTANRFTSAGLGLTYSGTLWSGHVRYEKVWADKQQRDSLALGVVRQLNKGHNVLFSARVERNANNDRSSTASLQHAWRPPSSPWTLLQQLDFIDNRAGIGTLGDTNQRLVYNKHINYRSTSGWELGSHLGFKRVLESTTAKGLQSSTGVFGLEARVDVNHWLDVGVHGVAARSWNSGITNWGYGASVGIQPMRNTQIEIGYNWRGIKDRDFFANNQRAKGVYVNLRVLFDEHFLRLNKQRKQKRKHNAATTNLAKP